MIVELLNEMRAAIPECRLIAFVDLNATLVLACSSAVRPPQEALDDIAETAGRIMPRSDDPLANPPFSATCPDQAVLHLLSETLVIVRSTTEMICCQCVPDVDATIVLVGAQNVLRCIEDAN